ncbi:hunchback TypA protein [Sarcoptes scabiei]|nr:hunchback TypA protein [Sarcoptes scabiei]
MPNTKESDLLNEWKTEIALLILRSNRNNENIQTNFDYKIYLNRITRNELFTKSFDYLKLPRIHMEFDENYDTLSSLVDRNTPLQDWVQKKLRNLSFVNNPDDIVKMRIHALNGLFQELGIHQSQEIESFLNPNVYEWSNWLTPTTVGKYPKFNTLYYLIILDTEDLMNDESGLRSKGIWTSFDQISNPTPPNDFYELTKLSRFLTIANLREYIENEYRQTAIEKVLPSIEHFNDGSIAFLPGDFLYPKYVPLIAKRLPRLHNETIEEFSRLSRKEFGSMNRIEIRGFNLKVKTSDSMELKNRMKPKF